MKFNRKQLLSGWIFAILWALTLFIWFASNSYDWGFSEFVQGTTFWFVFAFLAHKSLSW